MLRKRFNGYLILIHVLLVALAATVLGLAQKNRDLQEPPASEQFQLREGETVAPFSAFDLEGHSSRIDFAQAERESLVFVFTTVCSACRANQANWHALYEQTKDHYEIVGISLNDVEATVRYREANALPFSVVVPEDIRAFTTAHKIDRVPLTLHLDRDGKVRSSWLGILTEDSMAQLAMLPAAKG